jgi:hypothetical protein
LCFDVVLLFSNAQLRCKEGVASALQGDKDGHRFSFLSFFFANCEDVVRPREGKDDDGGCVLMQRASQMPACLLLFSFFFSFLWCCFLF